MQFIIEMIMVSSKGVDSVPVGYKDYQNKQTTTFQYPTILPIVDTIPINLLITQGTRVPFQYEDIAFMS